MKKVNYQQKKKSKSKQLSISNVKVDLPRTRTEKNLTEKMQFPNNNQHRFKHVSRQKSINNITISETIKKSKKMSVNGVLLLKSPNFGMNKSVQQKLTKKQKTQDVAILKKKLKKLEEKLLQITKNQKLKKSYSLINKKLCKQSKKINKKQHCSKIQIFQQSQIQQNHKRSLLGQIVTQQHSQKLKNCLSAPLLSPNLKTHFHYYTTEVCESFKQKLQTVYTNHLTHSLTTINFMKSIPRIFNNFIHSKFELPKSKYKKTIIFDLDETLIHCNQSIQHECHFQLKIKLPNNEIIDAGINIRPHLQQVLERLSKRFQLVVFTASHQSYANAVIDYLDPKKRLFSSRLFRRNCLLASEGMYVKDLSIFKNRNLSELVLVDNAAYSYFNQLDNGIPIIPYYHDSSDTQLLKLQQYLYKLQFSDDVRTVNRQAFKLSRYINYSDPHTLVKKLYLR